MLVRRWDASTRAQCLLARWNRHFCVSWSQWTIFYVFYQTVKQWERCAQPQRSRIFTSIDSIIQTRIMNISSISRMKFIITKYSSGTQVCFHGVSNVWVLAFTNTLISAVGLRNSRLRQQIIRHSKWVKSMHAFQKRKKKLISFFFSKTSKLIQLLVIVRTFTISGMQWLELKNFEMKKGLKTKRFSINALLQPAQRRDFRTIPNQCFDEKALQPNSGRSREDTK